MPIGVFSCVAASFTQILRSIVLGSWELMCCRVFFAVGNPKFETPGLRHRSQWAAGHGRFPSLLCLLGLSASLRSRSLGHCRDSLIWGKVFLRAKEQDLVQSQNQGWDADVLKSSRSALPPTRSKTSHHFCVSDSAPHFFYLLSLSSLFYLSYASRRSLSLSLSILWFHQEPPN